MLDLEHLLLHVLLTHKPYLVSIRFSDDHTGFFNRIGVMIGCIFGVGVLSVAAAVFGNHLEKSIPYGDEDEEDDVADYE